MEVNAQEPLRILQKLILEVQQIVESDKMFSGTETPPPSSREESCSVEVKIVEKSFFLDAVEQAAGEAEAVIENYWNLLRTAETYWVGVSSNSFDKQLGEFLNNNFDRVYPSVRQSKSINKISNELFSFRKLEFYNLSEFKNYFATMIDNQIAQVCYARALTLQRNFIPTEMTLSAYKRGLLPFGWEWGETDSLLCIKTSDLL